MRRQFTLGAICALLLCPAAADDRSIPAIGPVGPIEQWQTGFRFTEGPAWDGKEGFYFSDIQAGRIYKVNRQGALSIFLEPSRHANGLAFNAAGALFACEMDGRVVSIDVSSKAVTPLVKDFQGRPFQMPNDLALDHDGGIYFTDAGRRPRRPGQAAEAFYYLSRKGRLTRLAADLRRPNGIILSPDQKSLYVAPREQAEVMVYPVRSPGKLGDGRVFCPLVRPPGQVVKVGGDGMAVDSKGNLFVASPVGIQVFDSLGKPLGILELTDEPFNAAFGGPDWKTLYVATRPAIYRMRMETAGFPPGR